MRRNIKALFSFRRVLAAGVLSVAAASSASPLRPPPAGATGASGSATPRAQR